MALTLISTHTASASATIDITSGIDSTYDSYEFHFVNMHPATDDVQFQFQVNAAGQSGFNETGKEPPTMDSVTLARLTKHKVRHTNP